MRNVLRMTVTRPVRADIWLGRLPENWFSAVSSEAENFVWMRKDCLNEWMPWSWNTYRVAALSG
jgi:hypothetical protein